VGIDGTGRRDQADAPIGAWRRTRNDAEAGKRTLDVVDLGHLLENTVPALGYELVDWDMSAKSRLVRVFIDKAGGVDVEDCARVSNHLTRLFAVEGIDFERLEVSSPGLDRPVKRLVDYARFAGQEAQLTLCAPVDGAKRIKGILRGTEGDDVLVETAGGVKSFPFGTIARARLVPAIDWRRGS
jgi:ribosome maturation factor RimP